MLHRIIFLRLNVIRLGLISMLRVKMRLLLCIMISTTLIRSVGFLMEKLTHTLKTPTSATI